MNPILIALALLIALVIYLIAAHKIDITHLKAEFASVKDQLHLTHAAALSVMATPATSTAAPADLVKTVTDAIAAATKPLVVDAVNPFVAWKAAGKDLLWIQTFGLQRALTAAEWDQAVAAGYVKDSGPVAVPDVPTIDLTQPVLEFARVAGLNIPVAGTVSKKYTGCPSPTWVEVVNGSGSTLTANGASHTEPNGQALNRLTVTPINGEVNVTVVCDTGGRTTLTVLAAPQ